MKKNPHVMEGLNENAWTLSEKRILVLGKDYLLMEYIGF